MKKKLKVKGGEKEKKKYEKEITNFFYNFPFVVFVFIPRLMSIDYNPLVFIPVKSNKWD